MCKDILYKPGFPQTDSVILRSHLPVIFQRAVYFHNNNLQQETPQCDETRFSTLQPSIDMTGIKNERWQ